ncbi:MAG: N-acetylmuramoyl-L-alanine amidase [Planctomycetes bacterium]|jgi:N-acetylmuramoyl-L-alanine amidase|nr:N-acetylmuramoyl-L-alanine amidase [Planctomycetota bacterium]
MTTRTNTRIVLVLLVLGLAGCQTPQKQETKLQIGEHLTTMENLARSLGLRIEERQESFVVLKNSANTVLIFTHPDGRFFVNGKPIGAVGEVAHSGGVVYVPDLLVTQIRPHLRSTLPTLPRPTPPKPRALVVVDAGHGGRDPGAIGAGGVYEKNINLQVAQRVAGLLAQRGVNVVMTRRDDRLPELEDRADLANQRNADLFVSIHSDSAPNRQVRGFTLYVAKAASANAMRAAGCLNRALTATGSEGHGIREADYVVLVQTNCPAVLIELGYLSNTQDTLRLKDPAWQNRLAQAIVEGILAYVQ